MTILEQATHVDADFGTVANESHASLDRRILNSTGNGPNKMTLPELGTGTGIRTANSVNGNLSVWSQTHAQ